MHADAHTATLHDTGRRRVLTRCLGGIAAGAWPWAVRAAPPSALGEWQSRTADVGGLRIHYVEQGTGPLVLLCHGFPENWLSWRHQIPALAAAGYRVVAPDLRGFGETAGPHEVSAYDMPSLVEDLTGLMDALGEKTAVLVGHDFGASLAWHAALLAPQRFSALAILSVPYQPPGPVPPTQALRQAMGGRFHYMLYFQEPGVAEQDLEPQMARFLKSMYHTASAAAQPEWPQLAARAHATRLLDWLIDAKEPPSWMTEAEFQYCLAQFTRNGLARPLNWYRNLDATWARMKGFADAKITHPTVFISGALDPVTFGVRAAVDQMTVTVPGLRRRVTVPTCGHWTQQEQPQAVNRELLSFLGEVAPPKG